MLIPEGSLEQRLPRILFVSRTRFGTLGTNASFSLPVEASKLCDVRMVEGPATESEAGLLVAARPAFPIMSMESGTREARIAAVEEAISDFEPDIVHLFHFRDALHLAGSIRKRFGRKPRILLDIRTPLLEERPFARLRSRLSFAFHQRHVNMISTHDMSSVATHTPFCSRPVRLLRYGIGRDLIAFRNQPERQASTVRLVFCGSLARKRKLEGLLDAFAHLVGSTTNGPQSYSLDVFGSGNREEHLRERAHSMGLSDKVRFHGLVGHSELMKLLQDYDIAVSYVPMELFSESPSLKTMEYLAAGLPVVASRTTAADDLISEGFSLEVFDNSASAFTKAVQSISANPYPARILRQNRELAARYDWSFIVSQQLLPIYRELIAEAGGHSSAD